MWKIMSKYTQLVSDKLREDIEEYIDTHHLKEGDKLPSERFLAELFKANRITLRKALRQMAGEGLIYSIPTQGTFLSQPKFCENVAGFISFSSAWGEDGRRVGRKQLKFAVVDSDLKTSRLFGVPLGSKVYELRRLRLLDDVPVSIETSYLLEETCPGLIRFDFGHNRSLYQTLFEEYGIRIRQQQQNIRATKMTEEETEIFCMEPGGSVFYISAVGIAEDGRSIERSICVTRTDRYAFGYRVSLPSAR